MFFLGRYFGKKDADYLPILDIGFRSHFATFLIYNAVNVSWFLFGFSGSYENINTAYYTTAIWGILLLIHFIISLLIQKKSINSLNAKDLFE